MHVCSVNLNISWQKSAKTAKLIEDIRKISEQKASIDLRYSGAGNRLFNVVIANSLFAVVRSWSGFLTRFVSIRASRSFGCTKTKSLELAPE